MNNTVFWSWNNRIEKAELEKQIICMAEQGIDGFFIHARDGLLTDYMESEWFDDVEFCVSVAKKYGIGVWLYDEKGWPSGSSAGKVEALGKKYRSKKLCCSSKYDKSFKEEIIACYVFGSNGEYSLCEFKEDADLYIYYTFDLGVDRMYKDSGKAFVGYTHEKYKQKFSKYFGKEIKGIFFDEPNISFFWPDAKAMAWSDSMVDGFEKYFGYNPLPHLWKMFGGGTPNVFHAHYLKTAGFLYYNNFIAELQKWCSQNNLPLVGHFCMEECLYTSQRLSGSVMKNYAALDIPGIDFLGRRNPSPLLGKQISSIAAQFDKKTIMCEAFGASGWDMSFSELLRVWRLLSVRGLNMLCMHLYAYSIEGDRKFDYPGYFSHQSVWWKDVKAFTSELSFLNDFASKGKEKNEVLVINPMCSLSGYESEDIIARRINSDFRLLLEELDSSQIIYDIGDEEIMAQCCEIDGDKIKIGSCEYGFVIVPSCTSIEKSTFNLLKKYVHSGGKVLFVGEYPSYVEFEKDSKFDEFIGQVKSQPYGELTFAKRLLLKKAFSNMGYKRMVTVFSNDGSVCECIIVRVTENDGQKYVSIVNSSCGEHISGFVVILGAKSVYEQTVYGEEYIDKKLYDGGLYFDIELSSGEGRYFCIDCENVKTKKFTVLDRRMVFPKKVTPIGDNLAVLDRVELSTDGVSYSKPNYVDKTFFPDCGCLYIKYTFTADEIIDSAYAMIEADKCKRITLNGLTKHFDSDVCGIDKAFKKFELTGCLLQGKNEIIVYYDDVKCRSGERIDSIILKGDFETKPRVAQELPFCFQANDFSITKRRKEYATDKDLTEQGLWFFAGSSKYSFSYNSNSEKVEITLKNARCVVAKIYSNGILRGVAADVCRPIRISLNKGDNLIEVVITSGNGNLFGPFHYAAGFPKIVSPNTFFGKTGITEAILHNDLDETNVFTEEYHFCKFGLGYIEITEINEAEEN